MDEKKKKKKTETKPNKLLALASASDTLVYVMFRSLALTDQG
jgi:hypothetical protein